MRYQPIFDLSKGAIAGVTAQIHWYHRKDGWIAPSSF
ncbi:MAG: hypothetical protein HC799_00295, partial [Limnothrix sp. RL_2_0]|nr:hypothetical protein [Limnothrix sp. RL_2_0]